MFPPMTRDAALQQVIDRAGGVPALASAIGVWNTAVYQWRRVPARHLQAVADLTGLPLHELRPDIVRPPEEPTP